MQRSEKFMLETVVKAAREAGKILKRYFHQDLAVSKKKGIGNIVTRADKEAEEVIVRIVKQYFPSHNILGEEGAMQKNKSPYLWSIDSCDGTLPYNNRLPWFAVSIGILKDDAPYVGVVLLPFGLFGKEELYTAVRGEGSYLNGKRIHVNAKRSLSDAIVGFDYAYKERERRIRDLLIKVAPHVRGTITLQWAAGPLCWIARGAFDGYVHQSLAHWDIAAATVIIEEAGGVVTDLAGKPIVWKIGKSFDYCASNGKIHKQLLAKINF